MKSSALIAMLLLCMATLHACAWADDVPAAVAETPAQKDARMDWWREARFGMFIHWGVYSVPAGEWNGNTNYAEWFLEETKIPVSRYEQFAKEFNPVKFDARAIVKLAKAAGMKYIVITSKHHDGFNMFPSKLGDWGIKSTPFGRDPLKELSEACKEGGLRFCVYYSIMDWHHSDWGTRRAWNDTAIGKPDMDRYVTYMKGQLSELITNYHPAVIWFDGQWEGPWTHARGVDLYNYLRALDPALIINNRINKARDGMAGMTKGNDAVGDFGTPEQTIPAAGYGPGVYWESCMTLNNHWGYNKHDQNWKSPETVIRNLLDIASKGGNYLLNVGPTSEGLIPDGSVHVLEEVAKWMAINGDAIHDTSASPFKKAFPWGRCTMKPGKLFLSVFAWPKDGTLLLPMSNVVSKAYLLAQPDQPLQLKTGEDGTSVTLPPAVTDPIATVIVVEFEGKPSLIGQLPAQAADGTIRLIPADATLIGSLSLEGVPEKNIGGWSQPGDSVAWTMRVTTAGKFNVELNYALASTGGAESEIVVSVGDQNLTGKLPGTGGWVNYKTVSIGTLPISAPGDMNFAMKANAAGGDGVMNLRSVVLKPAK